MAIQTWFHTCDVYGVATCLTAITLSFDTTSFMSFFIL